VKELVLGLAFFARAALAVLRGPPPLPSAVAFFRLVSASVPVVFAVSFFAGAMLTVQAAASLTPFGASSMAGLVVGFGGIREVFPLLAAAAVAARAGAEFASELGTMRTTQQVDALEVMGLDPMRLLVAPRIVGAVLGTPLCVLVSCGAGMLGSQAVGALQLGLDRGAMWTSLWSGVVLADITVGAVKGLVLGFLLAAVSTREGLVARGGALGVGRATNRAVIRSLVVVCGASLALSAIAYGGLAR
jgi:phospholipid/cholesterol/gamma-HCH transport system permease protein